MTFSNEVYFRRFFSCSYRCYGKPLALAAVSSIFAQDSLHCIPVGTSGPVWFVAYMLRDAWHPGSTGDLEACLGTGSRFSINLNFELFF